MERRLRFNLRFQPRQVGEVAEFGRDRVHQGVVVEARGLWVADSSEYRGASTRETTPRQASIVVEHSGTQSSGRVSTVTVSTSRS